MLQANGGTDFRVRENGVSRLFENVPSQLF